MRFDRFLSPPLVAAACLVAFGCDAVEGPREVGPTVRASDEDVEDEDSLSEAPYRVVVDADENDGAFKSTLDLSEYDPERPVAIFMESSEEGGELGAYDLESGELIAVAEPYGAFEGKEGSRFVSKLELNPSAVSKVQLVAEASPSLYYWAFMLCDEMVENRNDIGAGSLRQAVADVRNNGSVCFDPVEFTTSAPVQLSGEILVSKDVHICGTGSYTSQIETGGADRIFHFGIGTDSSLIDLGLNDGAASEGGLVKNRGTLQIEECELHSGEADQGGAIFNEGNLWIEDSSVIANNAGDGGGIYTDDGSVTLRRTTVRDNTAERGGGIYGFEASFSLRTGSLIMHNHAPQGGGLFIDDAFGIHGFNAIWGGSITSNTAEQGGGVYMNGGQLEIDFNGRGPGEPSAVNGNLAIDGGGLYLELGAFLEVRMDNEIRANGAQGSGGGIYNEGQVELHSAAAVFDNDANQDGGGVYNVGTLELFGGARIADNATGRSGGGVYNESGALLKIWDSAGRIEGNAAVTQGGSGAGGGVLNEQGGTVDALSHEIVNNTPNNLINL